MYEKFYKLTAKPFQLNPDPRFFFKSKGHLRAQAYLRYGLQQGQGFIVVTGDVGTGKTMLCNTLFRELEGQNVVVAKVVSTNVKEHDLLRLVAADLGLAYERATKAELLMRLQQFFKKCVEEGKRVLLVIDEAQNLPRASVEELRMLSNFDYRGQPIVQSFLLGQREFRGVMRSPGMEQLRQRVLAAYHLKPLSEDEIRQYIQHRLQTADWQNDPQLDLDIFPEIHRFTGGVPRRINTLMDRLLLHSSLEESHVVALQDLQVVTAEITAEHGGGAGEISQEITPLLQPVAAAADPGPDPGAIMATQAAQNLEKIEQRIEQRLELQLAKMQQAVDKISVSLQPPPPRPMPAPEAEKSFPRWTVAFSLGLLVLLAMAGALTYFLLYFRKH